jgi:hypothetical protein
MTRTATSAALALETLRYLCAVWLLGLAAAIPPSIEFESALVASPYPALTGRTQTDRGGEAPSITRNRSVTQRRT